VIHETGSFEGAGGMVLYSQRWLPDAEPNAALIITHGFGEHSDRYAKVVEPIVASGIAVHSYDQRGHGQSPGQRGHIRSMSDYRDDADAFINGVATHSPGTPIFLWGHSMGSLVALDYAIRRPDLLQCLITSGVGLEPAGVATSTIVTVARTFSRIWPTFKMTVPLDADLLTQNSEVVNEYLADKLVHGNASARWAVSLLDAIDWIKDHAHSLQLPLLMIHGGSDQINLPSGSENFVRDVQHPDKQLIIYPDSLHEVHNDVDSEQMIADLMDWIHAHSQQTIENDRL
jgi:alpha-beta hydrolase superfamily lysophospholipase